MGRAERGEDGKSVRGRCRERGEGSFNLKVRFVLRRVRSGDCEAGVAPIPFYTHLNPPSFPPVRAYALLLEAGHVFDQGREDGGGLGLVGRGLVGGCVQYRGGVGE
jgi:hypothetical protein